MVVHRCFHVVSDAKDAINCHARSTLDAFPFLSATKLPFTLARYFQIREFIFDASGQFYHLPIGCLAVYEAERFVNFLSVPPAVILANSARQIKREQGLQSVC